MALNKFRILGVDPGSRLAGFGCIDIVGKQLQTVTHGTLKLAPTSGTLKVAFEDRLLALYEGLKQVIQQYQPGIMAVEQVFFAKNALSALKLGQARGVALLVGKLYGLEIVEYSPTHIKQAVAGHGQADKEQVARRVQLFVGRQQFTTPDASDALALAICHAHQMAHQVAQKLTQGLALPESVSTGVRGIQRRSKTTFSLAECVRPELLNKKWIK
jgi:crossover junction endodeoxyribonuclease RuvC